MSYIIWYPPNGDAPITVNQGQQFTMPASSGFDTTLTTPQTIQSPGQIGETLIDQTTGMRVLPMTWAMQGATHREFMALREQLVRAMLPVLDDSGAPVLGRLEFYRDGLTPVMLSAVPRNSPQITMRGPQAGLADIELVAPDPHWSELLDRFVRLESSGGFTFPLSFPFSMYSYNTQMDIFNPGHVAVPILARLYGGCTTPRLRLVTKNKVLEVTGSVAAGTYVEIDTAFGQKKAALVDSAGNRTNITGRVNLARGDFWQLPPGLSTIRFEADVNVSGIAVVFWRPRFVGV